MNEEQIREIIKDELRNLLASDRYVFHKTIQILDGRNIQTGRSNGTKIGTATDQKLALYGVTPVVQPTSSDQASLSLDLDVSGLDTVSLADVNANFTSIQTLVNQLRSDLVSLGIIKGS